MKLNSCIKMNSGIKKKSKAIFWAAIFGAASLYAFGPVSMQMYLTRDVSEKNIGADSNRVAVRLLAPL